MWGEIESPRLRGVGILTPPEGGEHQRHDQSAEVCTAVRRGVLEVESRGKPRTAHFVRRGACTCLRDYVCIAALRAERAAARERSFQQIILRFPSSRFRAFRKRQGGARHHATRRDRRATTCDIGSKLAFCTLFSFTARRLDRAVSFFCKSMPYTDLHIVRAGPRETRGA